MEVVLHLEPGLSFSFSEKNLFQIPDDSPPLIVEKGKIYGIYGLNGLGKTTLLNLLNGFLCPKRGKITFFYKNKRLFISKDTFKEKITPVVIANFGCGTRRIFQVPALAEDLSLIEALIIVKRSYRKESITNFLNPKNLFYRLKWAKNIKSNEFYQAYELLKQFDFLDPFKKIGCLSYGERRIITVLQMVYSNVGLLLLDEPFANIHINVVDKLKNKLLDYVLDLDNRRSIILVEHRKEYLKGFSNQIWNLSRGKLIIKHQI